MIKLKKKQLHVLTLSLLSSILTLSLGGCAGQEPIRVGFAGELTGRNADLGIHGRNGVQLAVETLNQAGGINGRPIDLLVRDDQGTPSGAQTADRELIEAGVVAIIGHMTSGQSIAALPVIEEAGVVLISPTTSTPELTGLDDHFFRLNPDNSLTASTLARQVHRQHGPISLAVIYDVDNAAYTGSFLAAFAKTYRALGGQVAGEVSFSSSEDPDFAPLLAQLWTANPEGLLSIASAADTALIAQQTRLSGRQIPLFTCGWAQTEALLQNGGQAVEGIKIVMNHRLNSQSPASLDFQDRYLARFGRSPTFAAVQAFETMLVLAAALEKTKGRADGLAPALLETRNFAGLDRTLSLDEYGDVVPTQFLIGVQDGQFVTMNVLEPVVP